MANSPSPKEKQYFQCVAEASLDLIKLPLIDILFSKIKPKDLLLQINSNCYLTNNLRQDQQNLCKLQPPDHRKFDVTLLYTLIRNLCPGLEPTKGWGKNPGPNDTRIGDDIERLKSFRNNSYAHLSSAAIPDHKFENFWKTLKPVLNRLMAHPECRVDYEREMIEIKRSIFLQEKFDTFKTLLEYYNAMEKQANEMGK